MTEEVDTAPNEGQTGLPRYGKRYRKKLLHAHYDVIIIGSGISGLTCAFLLAQNGRRVLVLEQHYTAGGCTHCFERDGYEWDVGLHYVGDMHPSSLSRRVMDLITGGELHWTKMDQYYDRAIINGESYEFCSGRKAFMDTLAARFPDQVQLLRSYLHQTEKTAQFAQFQSVIKILPPSLAQTLRWFSNWLSPSFSRQSVAEAMTTMIPDPRLRAVLTMQWGDYGSPPKEASFQAHALVATHYLEGAYFPIGGASRIAACTIPKIEQAGGQVLTYAAVREIKVQGNRAVGVTMENGDSISANTVISSAGVMNTFTRLLPDTASERNKIRRRLEKVAPSYGYVCVFVGFSASAQMLHLPKSNTWVFHGDDHDQAFTAFCRDSNNPFPFVYISFPSAKDPEYEKRRPGRSTAAILTLCPAHFFDDWKDTSWGKRGPDYAIFKNQLQERLLGVLYAQYPQLESHVDCVEVSTPLTTNYFCHNYQGETYGLSHNVSRFKQYWLGPQTPIKGLFVTGQDQLSCGVVASMMSGCFTAIRSLGWRGLPLAAKLFGPH